LKHLASDSDDRTTFEREFALLLDFGQKWGTDLRFGGGVAPLDRD